MGQAQQEVEILSARLTQAENQLKLAEDVIRRQAGAILDVDLKAYHAMKQLLQTNDVYKGSVGHEAIRTGILEIMNDLKRFMQQKFRTAGIDAYYGSTTGDRPIPHPNGQEAEQPRLSPSVSARPVQQVNR